MFNPEERGCVLDGTDVHVPWWVTGGDRGGHPGDSGVEGICGALGGMGGLGTHRGQWGGGNLGVSDDMGAWMIWESRER